jgi:polysaccharide export outer membrane protein
LFGYRVDTKGEIDIPVVGKVKAEGKTIEELQAEVLKRVKATGFLVDPNVQVRFMSFRLTILGETGERTFILPTQQINILQAIGLTGGLRYMAKRDNILVIREQNGVRIFGRINLKSKEIFNSPFYYLQPNDIIYIQPHRAAILSAPDPASRYLGVIVGVISFVTLIVSLNPF